MRITVENAGPDEATIDVLPTLWFRNTWSWGPTDHHRRPSLHELSGRIVGQHDQVGTLVLAGDGTPEVLFGENETNVARLYDNPDGPAYAKDGINDHVVHGAQTVNPDRRGTKAALCYRLTVPAGGSLVVRVRLVAGGGDVADQPVDLGVEYDAVMALRQSEADAFYSAVTPAACDEEEARVLRQAFAGLLWSKQFYHFDVERWLDRDPGQPAPPPSRGAIRNGDWRHLNNHEVLLMPDPWEYPWYAAWDLAFHCVTLAHIDPGFAKSQLVLLREWYLHPSGQIPAYEWNFSDVNPPVHAWAALRVFELDGGTDYAFLVRVFHKLLINFTWWTNNKDHGDNNLFEGGFMGLDNIAPIDRSNIPPDLGYLEQADSTAWMAMYALDLLAMAVRLALHDRSFEDVAVKFFEHFLAIAYAANHAGLWDEEDAYFYDILHLADGRHVPIKVRSLVGLVPITAAVDFHAGLLDRLPEFAERAVWYLDAKPQLATSLHVGIHADRKHRLLCLVSPERLVQVLDKMFDEQRLLAPYGIRSLSAWHRDHPFAFTAGDLVAFADYEPAESTSALFGGNSNWRIWFPLNALLVEAMRDYDRFSDGTLTVEYPAGSRSRISLGDAAADITRRLVSIFLPGPDGRRPVHGPYDLLATDPRWRDNIPFHEYFHGDTGAGLGATHQTGWTALVAHMLLDVMQPSRNARAVPEPA